ncbi:MAG: M15 family metallopeptidase [Clostridiales bacterium]|nr:M15 family metallopeptidase [Clostridiales bacterium]
MYSDFDFVDIKELTCDIEVEIRYATLNNYFGKKLYESDRCILRYGTAKKLINANKVLMEMGFRLKVWDAYRPLSIQKYMWDIIKNEDFIAPPWRGSIHNRGAAVDVTLVKLNGEAVCMPTDFDDFTIKASINYNELSDDIISNREILADAMIRSGFNRIDSEWWHFYDIEYKKYKIE